MRRKKVIVILLLLAMTIPAYANGKKSGVVFDLTQISKESHKRMNIGELLRLAGEITQDAPKSKPKQSVTEPGLKGGLETILMQILGEKGVEAWKTLQSGLVKNKGDRSGEIEIDDKELEEDKILKSFERNFAQQEKYKKKDREQESSHNMQEERRLTNARKYLRVGMTEDDIRNLLGSPLSTINIKGYTHKWGYRDARSIWFDSKGTVEKWDGF